MSEVSCTACQDLKSAAPEFVTNGVTDTVCNSLANNTGLDSGNGRNDATDLHLANDCLVGRMQDEIRAYDVCDWKKFMKLFIHNVYEMFKALICTIRGVWTQISNIKSRLNSIEDGEQLLCDVTSDMLELALHRLHGVAHTKVHNGVTSDGGIMVNTVTAEFCDKTAVIDMIALFIDAGTTTGLKNGDIIYTIEKSAVVPRYMHESTWNGIMTYGFMQSLCTVEGQYVVYAVAAENEAYPGKLSVTVHSTIGPTAIASGHIATIQNTPRFFIISG